MKKTLSRQRRWQIKQRKSGRCAQCGGALNLYRGLCDRHAAYARELQHKRLGLVGHAKTYETGRKRRTRVRRTAASTPGL